MPIIQTIGTAAARAYGLFKKVGAPVLTGNYLYTWGINSSNQLGQYTVGTTVARSSPVQIGIRSYAMVATGKTTSSAMAVDSSGQLWGWGANPSGMLGIGSTLTQSSPVQVGTLTNWAAVSVGTTASGAVKTDGTLWTWGIGTSGQLGNGTTTAISSPVQVGTLTTWSKVSAGTTWMLALKIDGTMWSWGLGTGGRLGNGTTTTISAPVQIGTLTTWTATSAAAANGFGVAGGRLYSWGTAGAIMGNGSTVTTSSPSQIGTLTTWSSVGAGDATAGAIKTDGTLWMWGLGTNGQLGNGAALTTSSPVQVGTLTGWSALAVGGTQVISARTDGTLYGWGVNTSGQLGVNTAVSTYSSPVQIGTLTGWTSPATAGTFSVLLNNNRLFTTGAATAGQLGQTTTGTSSPIVVGLGTEKWASVVGGVSHFVALSTNRTLWAWGGNNLGQGGSGNTQIVADYYSAPTQIGGLSTWNTISAFNSTTFATKIDGSLWAFGDNTAGSMGIGAWETTPAVYIPNQITNYSVAKVASGAANYSMYVGTGGQLYALGQNSVGQLGDGTTVSKSSPVQIGTLTNWADVQCANSTSVALKTDGTLWTWGGNSSGQLGDGTTINQSSPVQVGTLTTWSKIYANPQTITVYAVKNNGTLWSWGQNIDGALGVGTGDTNHTAIGANEYPYQYGQQTWSDFSYGSSGYGAFVSTSGALYTAGLDTLGQLGNGVPPTGVITSSLTQVGTYTNWSKVFAGTNFTISIKNDGTLWGWGRGENGQLGVGGIAVASQTSSYSSPVQIPFERYATMPANGTGASTDTSGAIDIYGQLWMWGGGGSGMLGNNSLTTISYPMQIGPDTNWSSLTTGSGFSLATKTNGTLWGWGQNTAGQLGNGTTNGNSSPIQVGTLTTWLKVVAGQLNVAAIKTDGTLWTWGRNADGQLGDGTTTEQSSPIQVGTLTTWLNIASGNSHVIATKTDGTIWAWGANNSGQLGDGSIASKSSPIQLGTLTNWSKVYAAADSSMSIKTTGALWGWGNNGNYAIPNGAGTTSSPVQVGTLTNWSSASITNEGGWANKTDGTLWGWGVNTFGQVGNSSTAIVSSPVQIGTLTNWTAVRCNSRQAYALNSDGRIYAAGNNNSGGGFYNLLGIGTPAQVVAPVQVGALATWSKAAVGGYFSLAIKTDGTLWAWGTNGFGQLGNGAFSDITSPIQVGTLTTWSEVQAGASYTIAVKTDGTLWSWGNNGNGALGLNDTATRSSPVQVGTLTGWSKIGVGSFSSGVSAVKTNGTLWTWGYGINGQLGNSSISSESSPVQVGTLTTWVKSLMALQNLYAFNTSNELWASGNGGGFRNGNNNTATYSSPVQVSATGPFTNVSKIVSNNNLIGIIASNNYVFNWGSADANFPWYIIQDAVSSPIQIGALTNWATSNIKTDGTLWTWGPNSFGQLGLNDPAGQLTRWGPTQVGTQTNWSKFGGYLASGAVKTDGTAWTWGRNNYGQLGLGNTSNRVSPVQVGTLTTWSDVAIVDYVGFFLKTDNTLWASGYNVNYNLGDGATVNQNSPVQIGTGLTFNKVTPSPASNYGGFAGTTDGRMYSWGSSTMNYAVVPYIASPVQLGTQTGYTGVNIRSGGLYVWGNNNAGQLGLNDNFNRTGPVRVGTLSNWSKALVPGTNISHSMALKTDGTLWAWGLNNSGQLGDSSLITKSSPVQVGTVTTYLSFAIGGGNSFAVRSDGTLWSWGLNSSGQLGLGIATTINRSSPSQVGTLTNWSAVAVNNSTCFATKTDGTLWSWGAAANGALGNGTTTPNISSPVQIGTLTTWISPTATVPGINGGALRSN